MSTPGRRLRSQGEASPVNPLPTPRRGGRAKTNGSLASQESADLDQSVLNRRRRGRVSFSSEDGATPATTLKTESSSPKRQSPKVASPKVKSPTRTQQPNTATDSKSTNGKAAARAAKAATSPGGSPKKATEELAESPKSASPKRSSSPKKTPVKESPKPKSQRRTSTGQAKAEESEEDEEDEDDGNESESGDENEAEKELGASAAKRRRQETESSADEAEMVTLGSRQPRRFPAQLRQSLQQPKRGRGQTELIPPERQAPRPQAAEKAGAKEPPMELSMEERLRRLAKGGGAGGESLALLLAQGLQASDEAKIDLVLEVREPRRMRASLAGLDLASVRPLLQALRSRIAKRKDPAHLLRWLQMTLAEHAAFLTASPAHAEGLGELERLLKTRARALPALLDLKGRLHQLLAAAERDAAKEEAEDGVADGLPEARNTYRDSDEEEGPEEEELGEDDDDEEEEDEPELGEDWWDEEEEEEESGEEEEMDQDDGEPSEDEEEEEEGDEDGGSSDSDDPELATRPPRSSRRPQRNDDLSDEDSDE